MGYTCHLATAYITVVVYFNVFLHSNVCWLWNIQGNYVSSVMFLTHWGRDKMATILQTAFWNAFFNENICVPIKISLMCVLWGPIDNIPALLQIMTWRRLGDKPLSEPMTVGLATHICVTRPQWVNYLPFHLTVFNCVNWFCCASWY